MAVKKIKIEDVEHELHATGDASGNVITDTYMTKSNPTGQGSLSINRKADTEVGNYSTATGYQTTASSSCSVAMGKQTTANGVGSVAIGSDTIASGLCSFSAGTFYEPDTEESAPVYTTASGTASIAMGISSVASGVGAVAMGGNTTASGNYSVAMGNGTQASKKYSVATGYKSTASGNYSVATGYKSTTLGSYSTAMGSETTASGFCSTAMGDQTKASGHYSTAMGQQTIASGKGSFAVGYDTTASGAYSTAMGMSTTALDYQIATGWYNNTSNAAANTSETGTGSGTAFVIGNGTSSSASNAFRVNYSGQTYGKSAYTTNGCDYAEYFEWLDSNPNNEDRRGYFVTLDGEKIKIAEPGDYILGIISGHPAVIGNGDEDWMGRYILDDFGEFIYEDYEYETEEPEEIIDEETGEITTQMKIVKRTCKKYKENPDYDPLIAYIQREDRPEWDAVGMVGVLSVRDDGTCQVNGYCKVAEGGTATSSDSGYRVIKRVNENIVKVIFK